MTSTTTLPYTGSSAICSDDTWLTDALNKEWNVQYDFNQGYGAKYFVSFARRVTYTEGSGSGNWKWHRIWENEGSLPDYYVGTQGNSDETVQAEGPNTVVFLNGHWIHPADRGKTWTREEYRWLLNSSAGAADGGWKVWMWDNNASSSGWKSDTVANPGSPDHMFIEDDPSNFTPAWSFSYLDDIYEDTTWSRVVIGSSDTYDGSYRREMMIPKTWSSTLITAYFHQGAFTAGTTVYVYVCDSADSCNATGTSLVIGGSGGNAAPSVDAGADQSITLPSSANLDGTVSDDVGVVGSTWTKVSGSGSVTFGDSHAVDTTASFSAADTYVLQLAASDGSLETTDTVTITVNAAVDPAAPAHLRNSGPIRIQGPVQMR
jgi:hypothetical protein